ncbi:MAG: hypothetical protein ACFFER_13920 [Candidatus Thorarchaeota archaeon]
MTHSDTLDEISSMLDLEGVGIRVVMKDKLRVYGRAAAGHYSPIRNVISINKSIIPYWLTTFTTVLHEFRHYQQRWRIIASQVTCAIVALGIWAYGMILNDYLFIYGSLGLVLPAGIAYLLFEREARRFEMSKLSGSLIVILAIEKTVIAHSLGLHKTASYNLIKLHKEIMDYAPFLIENNI